MDGSHEGIRDLRPGTEVIVPGFTFISSSQAAQRLGAVAVPVDVDPDTYNLDVAAAAAAITPRTRAIMPVHMRGMPAQIDAILEIAAERDLRVVEDVAPAACRSGPSVTSMPSASRCTRSSRRARVAY